MNKTILMGRLTKDPQSRVTQSNKKVVDFAIAINNGTEQATFIDCQAWEKSADVIEKYFKKGSNILIEGRLATYTHDTDDGKKLKKTYVIVERIEFVDSKKKEEETKKTSFTRDDFNSDDLPF